ncbi:MAG TPA: phenylacetate--CoA ligase [Phycisphaerae bacterium]|nr:phenylacetate--CoA ligase [Phycisphaerae bacterium]HPS53337.1 phenylacetate--CoA ligase [Phycisphaerae bacterium]
MKPELENMIWDKAETLNRDDLAVLQLERLKRQAAHAMNVPFYKNAFAKAGVTPDDIKSLDDIRRLPFTTKADMRENYPLGLMAVSRDDIARIHGSSGTTGKPTFVAYTKEDMKTWSNLVARFLVAGGLRAKHIAQVAFGYGLFTGGFGLHYGIETVGAAVVPASAGNTPRQLMLLEDLGVDVLICTPSYALNLAEIAAEMNCIDRLKLKFAHFGGEPWTEDMRRQIEDMLQIYAFNNYGLSEVIGPGVSGECIYRRGMHFQEDHFIVECINPKTLEPVAAGEKGELVITSLTKQAMPVIRYRTRDIASIDDSPCQCGRTGRRMSRVIGRTDDMMIIRGVNIFPSQIEEAILRIEGTAPHYLIELSRPGALDIITVKVEILPNIFSDRMSEMQNLHDRLVREIQNVIGVRPNVELVKPQSLERFVGKAKRVVDNRKLAD